MSGKVWPVVKGFGGPKRLSVVWSKGGYKWTTGQLLESITLKDISGLHWPDHFGFTHLCLRQMLPINMFPHKFRDIAL